MNSKKISAVIFTLFCIQSFAQQSSVTPGTLAPASSSPSGPSGVLSGELPNGKRIRRHLTMIVGLTQDEEFLIPDRPTMLKGRFEFFDMERIDGTDIFRITPKKVGSGIVTVHDSKTKQMLVEIRFDIRDDTIERGLREVQSLLGDIEGIEFKVVSGLIIIDGYVLLPRELLRISQVVSTLSDQGVKIKTLASLSPLARQRIANFISNDVNNPEVKVTAVGDYIKLEGQVNSLEEKQRIKNIVSMFLPDLVIDMAPQQFATIVGRKNSGKIEDLIIDLITIKKDDEKVEPPPKLIQVVVHFVKFADSYEKKFSFEFQPAISATAAAGQTAPTSSIQDTARLLSNLLPKLRWAKAHGFAKVLDTASILVQDNETGTINRTVLLTDLVPAANGGVQQNPSGGSTVLLTVRPKIKSERSGLIEFKPLKVTVNTPGKSDTTNTLVETVISVRDRQSAAFGGVLRKVTDTKYGAPAKEDALITLQASKEYARNNSQFVVFITPIIKSSASTGVEQVKKKFRLRD